MKEGQRFFHWLSSAHVAFVALLLIMGGVILVPCLVEAQAPSLPTLAISVGEESSDKTGLSALLKVMLILTSLTFIPAIILTMTCFTRIIVVLGMTRTAIGTQSAPPNLVITGLALFLTVAVMQPVFQSMYEEGLAPYLEGSMSEVEALKSGVVPLKLFLSRNAREKDISLFLEITRSEKPEKREDLSLLVAAPAFVVSELNTAFQIGFLIALPFLVLDMVVSSVLTAMSMITLPPVVISLPLKLMLFVLVDGWALIIGSLARTYAI